MALRPAVTNVPLISKKLGEAITKAQPIGAKCKTERNGACLGEFIVWFRDKHYVKINASDLHQFLTFTDGKVSL